jgi:hypothetical protein
MSFIHNTKQLCDLDSDFYDEDEEEEEQEEQEQEQKFSARSESKLINFKDGRMRSRKAVPSDNIIINDTANTFNAPDSKIAININQNIKSNPNVTTKINVNKRKITESINISIE